jgi:hypothetical protein
MSFWNKRKRVKENIFFAYSGKKANGIKIGGWENEKKSCNFYEYISSDVPRAMNSWHCFDSFISKSVRQHAGLHAWLFAHTTHRTMCSCTLFSRSSKLLVLLLDILYSRYRNSPTDVGDDGSWSQPIQTYFCVSLPPTQTANQPTQSACRHLSLPRV